MNTFFPSAYTARLAASLAGQVPASVALWVAEFNTCSHNRYRRRYHLQARGHTTRNLEDRLCADAGGSDAGTGKA
jgi:hypothetical protein